MQISEDGVTAQEDEGEDVRCTKEAESIKLGDRPGRTCNPSRSCLKQSSPSAQQQQKNQHSLTGGAQIGLLHSLCGAVSVCRAQSCRACLGDNSNCGCLKRRYRHVRRRQRHSRARTCAWQAGDADAGAEVLSALPAAQALLL